MLYPTLAKVTFYEDDEEFQDSIAFFSTSYADAVRRIEKNYANTISSIDRLELWEESDFLYVDDNIIEELRKKN